MTVKAPNHRRPRRLILALVGFLALGILAAGPAQAAGLSEQEQRDLLLLREEEKLARDVYQVLLARWGMNLFSNIAASEQNHMDAVKVLLEQYEVKDPALSTSGVFTNQELQTLYNDLIALGSVSSIEALKVGLTIENTDIADLEAAIENTEKFDIQTVYKNLLDGSRNHLAAFTTTLAKRKTR